MQVATSPFYDRSARAMATVTAHADRIQTEISTGKKLQAPSDDAAAYARLRTIARDGADATTDGANLGLAASLLQQADTTLTSITAQVQRASELAIQARSGSLNTAARQAIATELTSIGEQLVTLGNAKDARGEPLFGGADGGAAVTRQADGSYSFASTAPSAIPIGGDQTVQASETAARIFQSGAGNVLATIAALATALSGDTDVDAAAATAVDQLATAGDQVTTVQASLGARASRVELDQAALKQTGVDREASRSSIEDTDVTAAITELQKTMTILSATQASFTKLQALSLFTYLR